MLDMFARTSLRKAQAILARGFVTTRVDNDTAQDFSALWLSSRPQPKTEQHPVLLRIRLDRSEADLTEYHSKEDNEWLIPTAVLNTYGTVEMVEEEAARPVRRKATRLKRRPAA